MVIHMFFLRWKPEATQAEIDRALTEIRAFQGVIPGLLETHAGVNTSSRSQEYGFGCVMKFIDQAALDAYMVHPQHERLVGWMGPLVTAADVDFAA